VSVFPKKRNKMFIIEIGSGIPYPKEEQRWQIFGEPLSRIFAPYFLGDKHFQWFRDDSDNLLAGINVVCFESSSKWKDSQNEQKDIELFSSLILPINDFFVKCGSWAAITGLFDVEESSLDLAVEAAKSKISGAVSVLSGQLPVEFDEPDLDKHMDIINHDGRYYVMYIGKQTGFKRFRELTKEQAIKIVGAN